MRDTVGLHKEPSSCVGLPKRIASVAAIVASLQATRGQGRVGARNTGASR